MYDVIVAGAGPAGATAAYHLGNAGLKVLVLERARLPRYKPCGGGLSVDFLKNQFPFSFDSVIDRFATRFSYHFYGLEVDVPCRQQVMALVRRDQFDAHILAHARAEVQDGSAIRKAAENEDGVTVETEPGRTYQARYLVGADGANSAVAHALGLNRNHTRIPAIEAEVSPPAAVMRKFEAGPVFIFDRLRFGYLWIFPKADHLSVGVADLHPKPGQLKETLLRVMGRYGISLEGVPLHGHPIPIYTRRIPVATRRTALAGDAAGLVDPLSGEGIRLAIKSGRMAAEAILSGSLDTYQHDFDRIIGRDRLKSWYVSQLFNRLRFLCLPLGTPNPYATDMVLEVLSDRASSLGLLGLSVLTLPFFLMFELGGEVVRLTRGSDARRRFLEAVFPGSYK